jgi:hypothetical protein
MSSQFPLEAHAVLGEVDATLATPLPVVSPDSVGFSVDRLNRLDDAMQVEIDAGHYAGISVMVARHGKPGNRYVKTPSSASLR